MVVSRVEGMATYLVVHGLWLRDADVRVALCVAVSEGLFEQRDRNAAVIRLDEESSGTRFEKVDV